MSARGWPPLLILVPWALGWGCASASRIHLVTVPTLPEGAVEASWAMPMVARAAVELFRTLSERGPSALIDLRLHGDELTEYYTASGRERLLRVFPGLTPRSSERRWIALRAFAGDPIVGWCARGVSVAEANGPEGFRERVLTVDRLLVVGREGDGLWATWLEGLVYTATGWRFVPTVSYGEEVQTARREHADIDLWDCDLGVRPPGVVPNVRSTPRPAG